MALAANTLVEWKRSLGVELALKRPRIGEVDLDFCTTNLFDLDRRVREIVKAQSTLFCGLAAENTERARRLGDRLIEVFISHAQGQLVFGERTCGDEERWECVLSFVDLARKCNLENCVFEYLLKTEDADTFLKDLINTTLVRGDRVDFSEESGIVWNINEPCLGDGDESSRFETMKEMLVEYPLSFNIEDQKEAWLSGVGFMIDTKSYGAKLNSDGSVVLYDPVGDSLPVCLCEDENPGVKIFPRRACLHIFSSIKEFEIFLQHSVLLQTAELIGFLKLTPEKEISLIGYLLSQTMPDIDSTDKKIYVACEINGWDPASDAYEMTYDEDRGDWVFKCPETELTGGAEFKFVINGKWFPAGPNLVYVEPEAEA